MKVKEYLVNRILELEKELKQVRNEKAGTTYGLQKLQEEVIKLNEKIEQYEIEREHIKEIITCNIEPREVSFIDLSSEDDDFNTLMSILDIKPEDYSAGDLVPNKEIAPPPPCWGCKHEELAGNVEPCFSCFNGNHKEVTTNAETKD